MTISLENPQLYKSDLSSKIVVDGIATDRLSDDNGRSSELP